MRKSFLFPRFCRTIGLVLLPIFVALFASNKEFSFLSTPIPKDTSHEVLFRNYNLTDECTMTGIIISLCLIAFSRLKKEDEYIRDTRLRSLQVSVLLNYLLLLILIWTVYGINFLFAVCENILTLLILFILIFNFNLYIRPLLFKSKTA
ncbi:MAG TPA: hypothetical protein VN721_14445 [Flavipsychrobacter sp.]|nr:hypothetical protein [Flavipsychrobacter sp.]